MPYNPLAGKQGSVMIATTSYAFGKWSANMRNKLGEVPNFTGGGYMQRVSGMTDADVTLEAKGYDEGNMPFTVGNAYTLILGYTSTVNLTVPTLCESIAPNVDVESPQSVKLTFKSNGSFTAAIV